MARRLVPLSVLAVFVAYLAAPVVSSWSRSGSGFDIAGLRLLPVSVNGRLQPFDSAARIALQHIRGSATVPLEAEPGRSLDANTWLLEVLARPDAADGRKIFPIPDRELLAKLGAKPAARGTTYLAFGDLSLKVEEVEKQAERIAKTKEPDRAPWEREMLVLRAKLVAYERLKNSVQPNSLLQREAKGRPVTFDFAVELARYRSDLVEAVRVAERRRSGGTEVLDAATEQRLRSFAGRFEGVSHIGLVAVVPPVRPEDPRGRWTTTGAAIVDSVREGRLTPPIGYVATLTAAFAHDRAGVFNDAMGKYRRWLTANGFSPDVRQAAYEAFYNVFLPLVRALAIYAAGLVLLAIAWRTGSTTVHRTAAALVLLAFALHTLGVAFTYQLAGRPSLLTLGGWATALAGLVLRTWRREAGMAACAATGLIALTASYVLAPGGTVTLLRGVPTVGLLAAITGTALTLGVAGLLAGVSYSPAAEIRAASFRRPRRRTATVH